VTRTLWELADAKGLRLLVAGASKDPNAKITILLVDPASARPVLAAKVPTTDVAATAVEAEWHMLMALESVGVDTIPRVVETIDFHGRAGLVTTAMQGMPMATAYLRPRGTATPAAVAAHFRCVEQWLDAFQTATARATGAIDMDGGVTERLAARFDGDGELAADLGRLEEIHGRLASAGVARTAVHGDLWCGNVLVAAGRTSGVVDWEGGTTSGEPVRDLARFAHMYALFLDRRTRPGHRVRGHRGLRAGEWGAGVRFALEGAGWFPDLFRGFLQDGLTRLGAPRRCWRDAALAGIAEVAATTDDPWFAREHLELFRRVSRSGAAGRTFTGPAARGWMGWRTATRPEGEMS
jgi:aminoglycoside phosphotransferase